jgi:hypothetical protein
VPRLAIDITYLRTLTGRLYLATALNLAINRSSTVN